MSALSTKAMVDARARLILFREMSRCAAELGPMTLQAEEFWEKDDRAAVEQLDRAIAEALGQVPLFKETAHV